MSKPIENWEDKVDKYWFISKDRTKGSTNAHRYEIKAFIKILLKQEIARVDKDMGECNCSCHCRVGPCQMPHSHWCRHCQPKDET